MVSIEIKRKSDKWYKNLDKLILKNENKHSNK